VFSDSKSKPYPKQDSPVVAVGFVFGLELKASQVDWPNTKCTFRLKRKVSARSCAGTIEPSPGFRSKAPNRVTTMPVLVDVDGTCRTIIENGISVGVAADHDREGCARSADPKPVKLTWKGAIMEPAHYHIVTDIHCGPAVLASQVVWVRRR
jgi:hypothetical protein